jgi:predicted O-methyltransferase YrrM
MSQVTETLVRGLPARRVLLLGTGQQDALIALARALPPDGLIIALEADDRTARTVRDRLASEALQGRVAVMIGSPSRYLHKLSGPFDVIVQNSEPTERAPLRPRLLGLLRPGGLLVTGDDLTIATKP